MSAESAVPFPKSASDAHPARVPVIEDHDRQSVDLMDKLAGLHIEALRARTGPEAIRLAASERPSVIFVDGLLPGMHGLEVARFIRKIAPNDHPSIVMTTAIYKNVKYKNEAMLEYGIDEYLVKPVAESALSAILTAAGFSLEAAAS